MSSVRQIWLRVSASLWFVPSLIVIGSMTAAILLVERTGDVGDGLVRRWPRIFGAGADGSREMLAAIATSMITVAGVVFSITIVSLSLASTQYSPRLLRNFMRDTPTQLVLGVFVGNFAYCLMVLRTVRGGDETFIPALAVLAGMAYAFVAISLLIYFIHHVAQSIQASSILSRIFDDAAASIDEMFPETMGADAPDPAPASIELPVEWTAVRADRNGYVTSIEGQRLLRLAVETGRLVRLRAGVGDFVPRGAVLAELSGRRALDDERIERLRSMVSLHTQRTPEQDPAFGIQQLVDVAVKALSPGINDPTTACMCVDQLGALVLRLSTRCIPSSYRMHDGVLRVITPRPTYRSLVVLAFSAIVNHSRGDAQVLQRVLLQVEAAAACIEDPPRRRTLALVARAVARTLGAQRSLEGRLARARARRLAASLRRSRTSHGAAGDP